MHQDRQSFPYDISKKYIFYFFFFLNSKTPFCPILLVLYRHRQHCCLSRYRCCHFLQTRRMARLDGTFVSTDWSNWTWRDRMEVTGIENERKIANKPTERIHFCVRVFAGDNITDHIGSSTTVRSANGERYAASHSKLCLYGCFLSFSIPLYEIC